MRERLLRWTLTVLSLTSAACASSSRPPAASAPAPRPAPPALAPPTCNNPPRVRRPFAIEWAEADRAALQRSMRRGMVAVRFDGCRAELIAGCTPRGTYTYVPVTPVDDSTFAHDRAELEQTFPPLASLLDEKIRRFGLVHLDAWIVGRWQAAAPNVIQMVGACAGATHIVTGVDVGAYLFVAGGSGIAPPGVEQEVLGQAGDRRACSPIGANASSPREGCDHMLRVELSPLTRAVGGDGCSFAMRWNGASCEWTPATWCGPTTHWNGSECVPDPQTPAARDAYLELDTKIRDTFAPARTGFSYSGTVVEAIQRFRADAVIAHSLYDDLQAVVDAHASPEWRAIAIARQGALYHALYLALRESRPPFIRLFSAEQEEILGLADASDNFALREKAKFVRAQVSRAWHQTHERELGGAAHIAVARYATAIAHGGRHRAAQHAVTIAVLALADLTPLLGDATLAELVGSVRDVTYSPGLFVRMAAAIRAQSTTANPASAVDCGRDLRWTGIACTRQRDRDP